MQRKTNIIRLIFVVVGIVMGITYTPVFWELWGEGDNQVLNNFFSRTLLLGF